jgi:small-conductance mechanosensitive channel
MFYGLAAFIPNLVVAVVIFVVGWLIGAGLGRVVTQVVNALRVDHALKSTGLERVLSRAGFELSSGKFLGFLVEWFFIIVFLVAALDVLHLTTVNVFISDVVLGYLPQVIVAVLILLVAAVIAEAAENVVAGSARAASLHAAGFLGKVARYAIWVFALLAALSQLNVATAFVQTLFTGVVIAFSLAVGLAFGLGGQATAARYLDRLQSEIKD